MGIDLCFFYIRPFFLHVPTFISAWCASVHRSKTGTKKIYLTIATQDLTVSASKSMHPT